MKLIAHFGKFLADEVNLNPDRIKTLTNRVETIEEFLRNSDFKPKIRRFSAQGSWSHGTIIKPPGKAGFDADLLMFVDPVPGWTAKQYILELNRVFLASGVYKEMSGLGNRCVTIDYANDFSLDVVPSVVNRPGGAHQFEVCCRSDDVFEPTDSERFTRWVQQQAETVGDDRLRESIRLIKYLRDIKQTFSCKSVLLTTLIAERITPLDRQQPHLFADTPTTLRTLIQRLDEYLQARPDLHPVRNPILPIEHFTRHWDKDKYANFRDMVHKYRQWIDDAFQEGNEEESISKWQRVFGDEFAKGKTAITAIVQAALVPINFANHAFRDAVDAVSSLGASALDHVRNTVPWMKPIPWRIAGNQVVPTIKATMHTSRHAQAQRALNSRDIVPKGVELRFEAYDRNGMTFAGQKSFNIQWQVVNTDQEAANAHKSGGEGAGLRGGFYPSTSRGVRWEPTGYRGVHWITAFVIRKRDKVCVGQSERFLVVVE
ncbi:hypothetical protein [Dongia sp.]|uniref:SMODS domain-containing nucleotidyltransferase n=1 Tax=Dongia sp. TaxID=1977262 RepID=UPI0035AF6A69